MFFFHLGGASQSGRGLLSQGEKRKPHRPSYAVITPWHVASAWQSSLVIHHAPAKQCDPCTKNSAGRERPDRQQQRVARGSPRARGGRWGGEPLYACSHKRRGARPTENKRKCDSPSIHSCSKRRRCRGTTGVGERGRVLAVALIGRDYN